MRERPNPDARVDEWTNYLRPASWLTIDADLALSRGRFTDAAAEGSFIPGALDRVIAAGVTVDARHPVFGSVRVRHFGPRPLIEDASRRSRGTTVWNGEVGYRVSPRARFVLEAFNLFNANVSDIDYFYTSRMPGEPAAGVSDVHTHPALPRSVRVGMQFSF
ncbi:MAG: TonB-dependent receptor [Acidimicrobiia bacterium]|nr:TonB-dependent receptor [Acidimicrobiia bacterium]